MPLSFRPRQFLRWLLVEPRRVYLTLGLPLALLAVCAILPLTAELTVRIAGFRTTLAGVWLVVDDIRQRTKEGNRATIRTRLRDWVRRFPSFFREPQAITGAGHLVLDSVRLSATATVWLNAPADASPEQRIHALEENIKGLRAQVEEAARRQGDTATSLGDRIDQLTCRYDQGIAQLATKVDDISTGGVDFEMMGVVWVIAGTALCTFPGEIASLVAFLLHRGRAA
jgi:hypothetical protein